MNLYLAVLHPNDAQRKSLTAALLEATSVYPTLDKETIGSSSFADGELFLGWVSTAEPAARPREYVYRDRDSVTLFSGLPVDAKERIAAHRASELAARWSDVSSELEGIYSLVKASNEPGNFELQTDLLGYENVFYRQYGESWVFSNSVALVEELTARCPLDPAAVALFISCGRMAADYTLLSDIKTLPAATRVKWQRGQTNVEFTSTEDMSSLYKEPRAKFSQEDTMALATEMQRHLELLDQHFSPLDCPLTGGRDSRVIFSLLSAAGMPASYYTHGQNRGEDAQLAAQVAEAKGLQHEFRQTSAETLLSRWNELAASAVRRADGMYPLQHLASLLTATDYFDGRLSIRLSGTGGGVGKGAGQPLYFSRCLDTTSGVTEHMVQRAINNRDGLVRTEGLQSVRRVVEQRIGDLLGLGIPTANIPEVSAILEGTGRGDGANTRATADLRDTFAPFCTRAFLRACASLPLQQKITSPLHHALIEQLVPEVLNIPFDRKNPSWGPRQPWKVLAKGTYSRYSRRIRQKLKRRMPVRPNFIVTNDMFDRSSWLEQQLDHARQRILDHTESPIWDVIDRRRTEELMSSGATAKSRLRAVRGLYHLWTVAEYEHSR